MPGLLDQEDRPLSPREALVLAEVIVLRFAVRNRVLASETVGFLVLIEPPIRISASETIDFHILDGPLIRV